MEAFLQRFGAAVMGFLCGFDRLFFRGTLRNLSYAEGLQHYLWANHILYKDFDKHSIAVSKRLVEASLQHTRERGREVRYLNSHELRLEDEARLIAARDGITEGPICVFRRVEQCMSFQINGDRATKKLKIIYRPRQCMHLYHYQIHPVFGFMHARLQTWFPFQAYICINGHEWLARQMDQVGLRYRRRDNGIPWVEDLAKAQQLFDQQLQANWPSLLNDVAQSLNPLHEEIFASYPTHYYWSVAQSEWSSDVLFRERAALQAIYPRLVRHAITTYGAADVMRFLGRKLSRKGEVPTAFGGEVQSEVKRREEGVRVKHWLNHNSIKLYDKGSILRPECTINDPTDFRVFRTKESDPNGPMAWLPMRFGIADLHRRGQVCQAANNRYLEALAAVGDTTPLSQLVEPLCHSVPEPIRTRTAPVASEPTVHGTEAQPAAAVQDGEAVAASKPRRPRRVRALNPLAAADATLLEAVSRHEFLINGLRNRDLRRLLFAEEATSPKEERRQSGAVTRKLRLLRAHGLLHKVPKTHRYMVSETGRRVITALLAARDASVDLLTTAAA
jgi:hypothetical protein